MFYDKCEIFAILNFFKTSIRNFRVNFTDHFRFLYVHALSLSQSFSCICADFVSPPTPPPIFIEIINIILCEFKVTTGWFHGFLPCRCHVFVRTQISSPWRMSTSRVAFYILVTDW